MDCSTFDFNRLKQAASREEMLALLSDVHFCGRCHHCLYAFVMAATIFSEEEVISLFGDNLLNKTELMTAFDELVGFKRLLHPDKERMIEMNRTLPLIRSKFADSVLIKHYVNESLKQYENDLFEDYFNMSMT